MNKGEEEKGSGKMDSEWYCGCEEQAVEGATIQEREAAKRRLLQAYERTGQYVCEVKADGIWCAIEVPASRAPVRIVSRTGRRKSLPELERIIAESALPAGVYVGELGYGSQAALERKRHLGHDYAVLFDYVECAEDDSLATVLQDRRSNCRRWREHLTDEQREWLQLPEQTTVGFVQMYDAADEGVVLKRTDETYREATWAKVKKQLTVDYVILDWERSTAETKQDSDMAARLICGAYVAGELRPLVKVAVAQHAWCRDVARHPARYIGRVVELAAFAVFRSGSLRHPSICSNPDGTMRLRDDKTPAACTL